MGVDRLLFFIHMQDATFIAFGGREPICCIIKPIKERLPALLLGMQSSKEENDEVNTEVKKLSITEKRAMVIQKILLEIDMFERKLEKGKKNIPNRKRKIFQLEKGKHSNYKKETIPIRKRKMFQLEKGKYSN